MTANSKQDKIKNFAPDEVLSEDMNIFGMPFTEEEADIIIIPVNWDVSVSYKDGTSNAPQAVKKAAVQIETFDKEYENAWHSGFYMSDVDASLVEKNKEVRQKAVNHIEHISSQPRDFSRSNLKYINDACQALTKNIENKAIKLLNQKKIVGVLGGDHSSPLGLIRALSAHHEGFSILQIDAHADLREAYEGFEYSHASVMHNALKLSAVKKLVQVGVRDFGKNEMHTINNSAGRIKTFFDADIKARMFEGATWRCIVDEIVTALEEKVYISFDIDGLSLEFCGHTGTPVPGGLSYNEAVYLIKRIVESKKKIIGFDLCEVGVSESEIDECVAARILYKLCCATAVSNGLV